MKRLTAALALLATTASAQEAADWNLVTEPRRDLTAAIVLYEGGLGVIAKCQNESFQLMVTGLVPESEGVRQMRVHFAGDDWGEESGFVGEDAGTAFSFRPAMYARSLRDGGRFDVVVAGGGPNGENLRYAFDIPPSASSVNQTLEACGKPVDDPRDALLRDLPAGGLPVNLEWAYQPHGFYPSGPTYARGVAVISCLTQTDGRVRDCVVETEWPADGGFGAAALRQARHARLRNADTTVTEVPQTLVSWTTDFRME